MAIDDRDAARDGTLRNAGSLRAVIDEAIAAHGGPGRGGPDRGSPDGPSSPPPMHPDSLAVGIWLGLTRPGEARRILELIESGDTDLLTGENPRTADPAATRVNLEQPDAPEPIAATSMLLARAASLAEPDVARSRAEPATASAGSSPRFGWATRLTRAEILAAGGVVDAMIARGAPTDVTRGFGLAWDAGVRIPRHERDGLLAQFVELETTVAEVLTGRDLRPRGPAPRATGLAAMLGSWIARSDPANAEVSAALDQGGEPARLGLIALWNAWAATQFRALIPQPTYELLVEPWITVMGPLPEP